jgi:hypothetical protein
VLYSATNLLIEDWKPISSKDMHPPTVKIADIPIRPYSVTPSFNIIYGINRKLASMVTTLDAPQLIVFLIIFCFIMTI